MLRIVQRAGAMSIIPALAACSPFESGPIEGIERLAYTAELSRGPTRIEYNRAGPGEAQRVVFVHGTPGSARDWRGFLQAPIPGVESVAIDRPGFGRSEPRLAVTTLEDHARALEPLLVERDGAWPILVGWSYGGPVVVKAALMYPERVGGLVVVAGALDPDLERVFWYQRVGEALPFLLPRWLRNTNAELIPLEDELRAMAGELAGLRVPVEIVHGTRDGLVAFENVDFMVREFGVQPGVTAVEGHGHAVVWTAPELIRESIGRIVLPKTVRSDEVDPSRPEGQDI